MNKKGNKNILIQTHTKRNKELCKLRDNKGEGANDLMAISSDEGRSLMQTEMSK